jgi:plasmid stabilization system protein ParE
MSRAAGRVHGFSQSDFNALRAADDAELRGDAVATLDLMERHPDAEHFWRPWRTRRLLQLAVYGPLLPRWATSRWILAQALQHLPERPGPVANRRVHRALETAIELRGRELPGIDRVDARCRVIDHDWAYRHLFLYEQGGLRHFLDRVAPPDLVAGADRIREWAEAPMGGYRLVSRRSDLVTWQDLATDRHVQTANIGSAGVVLPGECVIGRLVPIETGTMFETVPLLVPAATALQTALDPSGWVEVLRELAGGTAGSRAIVCGDIAGLANDVSTPIWMTALQDAAGQRVLPLDLARSQDARRITSALMTVARDLVDGPRAMRLGVSDGVDLWACVAAGVLTLPVFATLAQSPKATDRAVLACLSDALAEPASAVCRELVEEPDEVA